MDTIETNPQMTEADLEDCGTTHIHEHHQSVLNRLARIEGHVRGIKKMVADGKPCPDVLIQVAAVRSAMNNVGRIILEDHLKGCMLDAVENGDFENAYQELKQSLDRLIS